MNKLHILIATVALLLLAGCRSSKGTSSGAAYTPEGAPAPTFGAIAANYGDWSDVSVPVTLRLTAPDNLSVGARARMVRGRCIDLSFRMLGFEVARVWISPDSVVAASRPKKICFTESLRDFMAGMPVSLGNLQDMLMGRPFLAGGTTLAPADSTAMRIEADGTMVRLLPRSQPAEADYGYVVDISSVVTALAVVLVEPDAQFSASYSGPRPLTPAGNVMDTAALALATPNADYAATIAWKWGSAEWNTAPAIDPPATNGLRRVTLPQLLQIVQSL